MTPTVHRERLPRLFKDRFSVCGVRNARFGPGEVNCRRCLHIFRANDRRRQPHSPEHLAAMREGARRGELRRAAVASGELSRVEAWRKYPPARVDGRGLTDAELALIERAEERIKRA